MRNERLAVLVEMSLTIALAAVLNMLSLWRMPQGGTISLVMLPFVVLGLRRGLVPAVVSGVVFGVVDVFIEPFVVHPAQFLLDYPLAFGALGLAGLFAASWNAMHRAGRTGRAILVAVLPAVALATLGRYAFHVVSGYVFFSSFAPPDQPVLAYSLVYNSFVLVSGALTFGVAALLVPVLARAFDGTGQSNAAQADS